MSERLNIQLDGSEIVKGVNDAVTALAELKAQINRFAAESPKGAIQAQLAALRTQAVQTVDDASRAFGKLAVELAKGMQAAEKTAKDSGRKVSKAFAQGLNDGDEIAMTVRAQRQRLQTEYEKMVAAGWRVKESMLAQMRVMGVQLFPDDRARLAAARASNAEYIAMVEARARHEYRALKQNEQALKQDLAGFQQMLKLKVAAEHSAQRQIETEKQRQQAANIKALNEDLAAYQRMLALKVAAEHRAAAEIAQARMNGLAGVARFQVNEATRNASGVFSSLSRSNYGSFVDPARDPKALRDAARAAAEAEAAMRRGGLSAAEFKEQQKQLAERSREVHAALRGVAGASGALWLTYGSLIPLTTAFFASSLIKNAISEWAAYEYQLQFVRAVADDTSVSLGEMARRVAASAKEVGVAPVEAAKGMRILAQAGLTSEQALTTLPGVLRLATIGELDLASAAETATGAVNAFGIGLDNTDMVVDVFAKSAAISNTSVRAITESMKQASTIAQRYKVDVEDVGVALVALAKRNITGSAAGTAITQMFEELATPRGEGRKVASLLGITLFDPMRHDTKKFFEEFVPQLREKLKQFDPESQTFILNRLTNNRGAKALSAILGLSDEELAKLKAQLQDATGFAARSVATLNDSVQGDLNKLKSAFQEALGKAGSESADDFRRAIQNLRTVVESPEMLSMLTELVTKVTLLAKAATWVGEAFVTWDNVRMALPAWVDPLGKILSLVEQIRKLQTDDGTQDKALSFVDSQIRKEQELGRAYDDNIRKLQEKLGLQAATTRAELDPLQVAIAKANSELIEAQKAYDESQQAGYGKRGIATPGEHPTMLLQRRNEAQARYNDLVSQEARLQRIISENETKRGEEARLRRNLARQEQERNAQPSGTRRFEMPDSSTASAEYSELRKREELAAAARRQELSAQEEHQRHLEAMLRHSYDRGAITFTEYQRRLDSLHREASSRRLEVLQEERAELERIGPQLKAAADKAKASGARGVIDQKAINDWEAFRQRMEGVNLQIQKLANKDTERVADNLTKALKPAVELVQAADKELSLLALNVDQELQKLAIKSRGTALSEKEAFVQANILRINNAQVDTLRRYEAAYEEMLRNGAFDDLADPAVLHKWLEMQQVISRIRQQVEDTQARVADAAGAAFDDKQLQVYADRLNDTLVDALLDAGQDGGEGLWRAVQNELIRKPLRVVLQAIMQPISNSIAQMIMGGVNSFMGGTGSGFNLSTLTNLFSGNGGGIGNLFSAGGMEGLGNFFFGTGGGGSAYSTSAGALEAGAFMEGVGGTPGLMGNLGGMASSMAGGLVFALAARNLMQIYKDTKGETRSGAQFVSDLHGVRLVTSSSGDRPEGSDDSITALLNSSRIGLNEAFELFGMDLRVNEMRGAWESSDKMRGGVFSGGLFNTGGSFGELGEGSNYDFTGPHDSKYELWVRQKPFDGTLLGAAQRMTNGLNGSPADLAVDLQQAYLAALQASVGIVPIIGSKVHTDSSLVTTDFESGMQEMVTSSWTEWTRTFDEAAKERARAEAKLPKRILDLIIDIDPEMLSDEHTALLVNRITGMVANVKGFRQLVENMPFEKLRAFSFDAAAGLVEVAGGLERLQAGLTSYAQNFLDPQRQREFVAGQITGQLRNAGLSVTMEQVFATSREEFAALTDSLEGRTDYAGQRAYAALLAVSEAFAALTNGADKAADALSLVTEDAFGELERVLGRQRRVAEISLNAAQKTIDKYEALFELLNRHVTDLYGSDSASVAAGQAYIAQSLLGMQSGQLPDRQKLSDAIDAVRGGLVEENFRSQLDFDRARMNLAGTLATMRGIVEPELTVAEQQLEAAQKQIEQLDQTLEHWREQIDLQRSNLFVGLTTAQAVQRLAEAMEKERLGAGGGIDKVVVPVGDAPPSEIDKVIEEITKPVTPPTPEILPPTPEEPQFGGWGSIVDALRGRTFARGGWHSGGWAIVGEEGPELAWMPPARIYTAPQTQQALRGGGALGAAHDSEVSALRSDLRAGQAQTLLLLGDIYKLFRKWDGDGMPTERDE